MKGAHHQTGRKGVGGRREIFPVNREVVVEKQDQITE